jgi:heat shock protein HtpX
MNVYDQIAANNRSTVLILCAFPAALFVMLFLLSLLLVKTDVAPLTAPLELTLMIFPLMFIVAAIWVMISYFSGGKIILSMAHARPITFEENRELFRLVENTCIMAGLPLPKIFLIEDESLNAFATGRKPEEASIALTSGIIKKLEKAELQTVIAHELAHIGNRDTRLMIITIAGIGCFLFFGQLLCRSAGRVGRGGKKSGQAALVVLAIGVVCLLFGYLVAPILRFALSRRREYQADATAVKITRDPDALARALAKISQDPRVEVLDSSPLVGNMCIANPAKTSFIRKLYLTHPPIENRIAALRKMG